MDVVGWSHPPRPIEVIPGFDPNANRQEQARAVIYDFIHDDDLRGALAIGAGGRGPWIVSGAMPLEDIDRNKLFELYLSPEQYVRDGNAPQGMTGTEIRGQAWYQNFVRAVHLAIAKREKLGPLPPNDYSGDPVIIYYYDNDWVKRIEYPRASISTASGMALDPANHQWWKGNGIGTYQRDPNTLQWGDEGFDWNKDIAGNISTILQVVVTIIGAILVATGVGAAAGAAFMAFGAALAAWGGVIDAALTSGDTAKAALGFMNAITKLAGVEVGTLPSGLTKTALQGAVKMLGQFSNVLNASQSKGLSFSETAAQIAVQAKTMGTVTDERVSQLVGLGGGQVLLSGYAAGQVADSLTLQGASSLMVDDATRTLFQMGAYLGLLKMEQAKVGSTDVGPQGTQHMTGQVVTAQEALSRFVMQLGSKYGLGSPSWTVFTTAHPDYAVASHAYAASATQNIVPVALRPSAAPAPKTSGGIPLTTRRM